MAQCACRHPATRALRQHGGQRFAAPEGVIAGVLVGRQDQHFGLVFSMAGAPLVVSANREGTTDVDPITFGRKTAVNYAESDQNPRNNQSTSPIRYDTRNRTVAAIP